MDLSDDTRRWLLRFARRTMAANLSQSEAPDAGDLPADADLSCGCFVSLHRREGGNLRGCIGTFSEKDPLWQNVRDMAIAASTRDPRFPPVTRAELEDCQLEISVLSPRRTADASDVEVGEHGINVTRGTHRGVLLPQVAVAHQWDRETFLDQTCVKAGLPKDAWRDGSVKIELFSADVFEEGLDEA